MKKLLFIIVCLPIIAIGCEPNTIKAESFRITYDRDYCVVSATQLTAEIVCIKQEEPK